MADEFHIEPTALTHSGSDAFQDFDAHAQSYSHQFAGDFYREQDTVTRGVTFPVMDLQGPGFKGDDAARFKGDFFGYSDTEDALLKGGSFDNFHMDPYSHHGGPSKFQDPFLASSGLPSTPTATEVRRFSEAFKPPHVPRDPLFKLMATSVFVSSATAEPLTGAAVGNHVLGFLSTEVDASISKVRDRKFWLKADVFPKKDGHIRYAMCTMKVRIYEASENSYAAEFSRYSGDSLVFHSSFKQACQYLKAQRSLVVKCEDGDITPPPAQLEQLTIPALPDEEPFTQGLAPILDVASLCDQPSLQAESAAMLAEHASTDAPGLCTDEVDKALSDLLKTDALAVAYPTARVLSELVACPKGPDFFAQDDLHLVLAIVSQVRRGDRISTLHLATSRLAEVVAAACPLVANRVPVDKTVKLQYDLMDALPEITNETARQSFSQAIEALKGRGGR